MLALTEKPKTMNLLEENIGEILCDLGLSKDFLRMAPKALYVQEEVDKLDDIKMMNFF